MIETLLHYNANPNLCDNDDVGGNTPLHMAVERNMLSVVDLMAKYHADPTIQNHNGFTVLHIAARDGLTQMV